MLELVHKPNPDFEGNPKMASTQYFWCFPTILKVFFRIVEDATLAMLRRFFQGAFNMCFPTLLSLYFCKSFSRLHFPILYETSNPKN